MLSGLRQESGQVTIEFALVLPFLMFIVIALVSFGIALNDAIDATHVANQGSRLAAVNVDPTTYHTCGAGGTSSCPTMEAYVASQAEAKDVKNAVVNFCLPDGSSSIGHPIRAIVAVKFKINAFIRQTFTIHGKSTMRLEQAATPSHYTSLPTC